MSVEDNDRKSPIFGTSDEPSAKRSKKQEEDTSVMAEQSSDDRKSSVFVVSDKIRARRVMEQEEDISGTTEQQSDYRKSPVFFVSDKIMVRRSKKQEGDMISVAIEQTSDDRKSPVFGGSDESRARQSEEQEENTSGTTEQQSDHRQSPVFFVSDKIRARRSKKQERDISVAIEQISDDRKSPVFGDSNEPEARQLVKQEEDLSGTTGQPSGNEEKVDDSSKVKAVVQDDGNNGGSVDDVSTSTDAGPVIEHLETGEAEVSAGTSASNIEEAVATPSVASAVGDSPASPNAPGDARVVIEADSGGVVDAPELVVYPRRRGPRCLNDDEDSRDSGELDEVNGDVYSDNSVDRLYENDTDYDDPDDIPDYDDVEVIEDEEVIDDDEVQVIDDDEVEVIDDDDVEVIDDDDEEEEEFEVDDVEEEDGEEEETEEDGEYKRGAFVVVKEELANLENPFIWKIDHSNLMKKYEPTTVNEAVVYKATSMYAGWDVKCKDTYYIAPVVTVSETDGEHIVDFQKHLIQLDPPTHA